MDAWLPDGLQTNKVRFKTCASSIKIAWTDL